MRPDQTTVLAAVVLVCLAVPSSPARAAPGAGHDFTWLLREHKLVVHPDGRLDQHIRHVKRLETLAALSSEGDPRIVYHRENQELILITARTTTPGGKVLDAPPYAVNSSTPDAEVACPRLARHSETVVTFVGLEVGATVELSYELRDRTPWRSHVEGVFDFARSDPVDKAVFSIEIPGRMAAGRAGPGTPAFHAALQDPSAVVSDRVDARHATTWRWQAENLPALAPGLPFPSGVSPRLYFSTAADWESALTAVGTAQTSDLASSDRWSKLEAMIFPGGPPAAQDATVFPVLFKAVRDSFLFFKSAGIDETTGPAPLEELLSGRQLTGLESAHLLSAILGRLGFDVRVWLVTAPLRPLFAATPVGASAAPVAPPPILSLLEAALVRIQVGSSAVFLDPLPLQLSSGPRYGWLRWVAVPARGDGYTLLRGSEALPRSLTNRIAVTACVDVQDGQATATATLHTGGPVSLWFSHPAGYDKPEKATALAGQLLPGLIVDSATVGYSSPESFIVTVAGHASVPASGDSLFLPAGPLSAALEEMLVPYLQLKARPAAAPGAVEFHLSLTVKAKEGSLISGIPERALQAGGAVYKTATAQQPGRLTLTRDLTLPVESLTSGPDAGLRRLLGAFVSDNHNGVVLVPSEVPLMFALPPAREERR